MEQAFWDSSSLVPLCVRQVSTPVVQSLSRQCDRIVVWWAAPIEVLGAFTRLIRMGQLNPKEYVQAQIRLDHMRRNWREIVPDISLRDRAESLINRFPLTAADTLQLAAATEWTLGHPRNRPFISGDRRLLDAARQLGFQPVQG